MPKVLERCVRQVTARGVAQSNAYAICTASLQRAGKLPVNKTVANDFAAWAEQVQLPDSLKPGMEAIYPRFETADYGLLNQVRKIDTCDVKNVLGLAKLHSRAFRMNPETLARQGRAIWYGAVALHEAQHAVHGFGEHEATQIEQRFAGKIFGEGKLGFDREDMTDALRVAAMAQGQRESDVHKNVRKHDFKFLTSSGFTPKMARKVMKIGAEIGKAMVEIRKQLIADGVLSGAVPVKQYTPDVLEPYTDTIEKAVTGEFEKMLSFALSGDDVLKTGDEEVSAYAVPNSHLAGQWEVFEKAVLLSTDRGFGGLLRGPLGIVPALRRADYDVAKLPVDWQTTRLTALKELVPTAAEKGLYTPDGSLTDAHVMMLMHGFSPALQSFEKDAIDAQDPSEGEES